MRAQTNSSGIVGDEIHRNRGLPSHMTVSSGVPLPAFHGVHPPPPPPPPWAHLGGTPQSCVKRKRSVVSVVAMLCGKMAACPWS